MFFKNFDVCKNFNFCKKNQFYAKNNMFGQNPVSRKFRFSCGNFRFRVLTTLLISIFGHFFPFSTIFIFKISAIFTRNNFQLWLEDYRQVANNVLRPKSVRQFAFDFIMQEMKNQPYLFVHWRYESDWLKM